ncbi:MAG TPA: arginine--tRNA ligase [Dictyoglomaceae bacterium]|nr:arginine--tRNA ligase [Dictyoglomaceae bacterium]HOL39128.1 arginine--tRNA ligase [Dictyoglomaceae bacterium]HOP94263.1 arginine--tRNA ligase [Dictyoglomaceae bacterium]HPP15282.1 arginine--tRNA ligase [Dictyoglomaceae bacterium]HPU42688.1 arginine--tRNA ligase [Dictyoglomaceae bacterium]
MRKHIFSLVEKAVKNLQEENISTDDVEIIIETPKQKEYGDYATAVALQLAQKNKKPPRIVAEKLIEKIEKSPYISKVEIAGPGFINFSLNENALWDTLRSIRKNLDELVKLPPKNNKIQLEFGSINPTGPMHIAHARGVTIGDSLANLFKRIGWKVEKEFYINDAGTQIDLLGDSLYARYMQLQGIDYKVPEEGYHGNYLIDLAKEILSQKEEIEKLNDIEKKQFFKEYALQKILEDIKKTLIDFGVEYDLWFSERTLHKNGKLNEVLKILEEKGYSYQKDGAIWFSSTKFGDEKDRVLLKSNGKPTYFLADIAYHLDKIERGFDWIIDIWGADHHSHVARLTGAIEALGYPREILNVILVQMVRLMKGNEEIKMSKRTGDFVTLQEVQEEVGRDPIRFFFLLRSAESQLDFDLELAKKQSIENPVYYVQYAHARCCSILKNAEELGYNLQDLDNADLSLIKEERGKDLILTLLRYSERLEDIARTLEIHQLPFYLLNLSTLFHGYYDSYRVLVEDKNLALARLALIDAVRIVIKDALSILGVSAPEKM